MKILTSKDYGLTKDTINQIIKDHKDWKIEKFEGFAGFLEAFSDSQQTNLFFEQKLYLVYDSDVFTTSEKFKSVSTQLGQIVTQDLAFVFIEINKKLSSAKEVKTFLTKCEIIDFPSLTNRTMPNYINTQAKMMQLKLTANQLQKLSNKLIPDAAIIQNELNKLKNYSQVTDEVLSNVICDYENDNIFQILQYWFEGNLDKALKLLDLMLDNNTEPTTIIATLAHQINQLYLIKQLLEQSYSAFQIAKELGIANFIVANSVQLIKNKHLNQLKYILNNLYLTDLQIKQNIIDKNLAIRSLLIFS
ncbi:DNA polymerase III subunit delta [Ureaplasma ceti]